MLSVAARSLRASRLPAQRLARQVGSGHSLLRLTTSTKVSLFFPASRSDTPPLKKKSRDQSSVSIWVSCSSWHLKACVALRKGLFSPPGDASHSFPLKAHILTCSSYFLRNYKLMYLFVSLLRHSVSRWQLFPPLMAKIADFFDFYPLDRMVCLLWSLAWPLWGSLCLQLLIILCLSSAGGKDPSSYWKLRRC